MGRCKYGQLIRTRLEEAREERRRALLFGGGDNGGMVEEDKDEDGEIEEDEEGSDDEGDKEEEGEDEGDKEEGGEDEEDEDEGSKACDSHWWIPSLLVPLESRAVVPEVRDHRVDYAEGTNKGLRSSMTIEELHRLARRFPWPKGVDLRLPCASGGALAKYPGCIVIYEDALRAGFRLPLHPLVCAFLSLKNYCPASLTPDSWIAILSVLLKFKDMNLIPSYEGFKLLCVSPLQHRPGIHNLHTMGYVRRISNPRENKWFLVHQSEEFSFNFPMYPGDHRWGKDYTMKKDDKEQDSDKKTPNVLPDNFDVSKKGITIRRLVEAGLSLSRPAKGLPIWKQSVSKRKQEVSCSRYPSKKAKKSLLPCTSVLVGREFVNIAHEEGEEEEPQEEEEDPQEVEESKEDDSEEEAEEEDPQEVEESKEDESEEEVEEELASFRPQERPIEPTPTNSTHLNGEKEVCEGGGIDAPLEGGRLSSFPPSEWINSVSTLSRPEVSTALRQLPELILAAQRSEQLERELDESRKENVELKGEKVELKCQIDELRRRGTLLADALTTKEKELTMKERELTTKEREFAMKERDFQSRIERMEQEKKDVEDKLIQTTQMATELLEIASPSKPMKIKL